MSQNASRSAWVTGSDAAARARSWAEASILTHHGDQAFEPIADNISAHSTLALARALAGSLIAARRARGSPARGAPQKRLQQALSANDLGSVRRALALIDIDFGGLRSWLAAGPLQQLSSEAAPAAGRSAPLKRTRRDVTPREAVSLMLWGEVWSSDRLMARHALAAHVYGILVDDADGRVRITETARCRLERLQRDDIVADQAFEAAGAKFQDLIVTGMVAAYSADAGRQLTEGDFATPLRLDVLNGKFVPSHGLELFSDEWERTRQACARIGQVRLSAEDLLRRAVVVPRRSKVTAVSIKRAEENLRGLCEAWVGAGAAMPKGDAWIKCEGARIAGSQRAARQVW